MAQTPVRVPIVRVEAGAEAPPELAEVLARAIRADGVEVVRIPARRELPASSFAELDEAARLFEQLDLAAARARVEAWLAAADAAPGAAPKERLLEGWLLSALVTRALGDAEASDMALMRARVIDPAQVLDPARYPPSLITRLAELAESTPLTMVPVRLSSVRLGLELSVDGGPWGPAPEELMLAAGRHAFRLRAPAALPRAQLLDVPAEGLELDVSLDEDAFAPLRAPDVSHPIDASVRDAAARLGAVPFLLTVVARPGGRLAVQVEDGGSGRVVHWVAPRGARAGPIAERALVVLRPEIELEGPAEGPPAPRWPIFAAVVAGVIAVAGVVFAVSVGGDDPTGWRLEGSP